MAAASFIESVEIQSSLAYTKVDLLSQVYL